MITPETVLAFWFAGDPNTSRAVWFQKDAAFDTACRQFTDALAAARQGALDHWADTPESALALLLLLDQFSRNLFRGSAEAFSADPQARALASGMIAQGFDRTLPPVQRRFVYLPFEHSEDIADQDRAVALLEAVHDGLGGESVDYAIRHRDVIRRFGRFPHRNAVLGRANSPAEEAYLAEPGAGF